MGENLPVIEVYDLKKYYPVTRSFADFIFRRKREYVKAVDGVSFTIRRGETLALIGESGCGKTTTGRLVIRLEEPTSGKILFEGKDITKIPLKKLRPFRKKMQMIYQDPMASLNPRMPVGEQIAHPLVVHGLATRKEAREIALEMLEKVGLTPSNEFYARLPHQLSGGQRQRVVIARAMALKPVFVVADEPVSMIDVSMRASILDLLQQFKREYNLTMLFITHDIGVGRIISDRIAVMYLGKIVEIGPTEQVINNPLHPYTQALIDAVPSIVRRKRMKKIRILGELPDPRNPPQGCRFHPRCPYVKDICRNKEPELIEVEKNHWVACHIYS